MVPSLSYDWLEEARRCCEMRLGLCGTGAQTMPFVGVKIAWLAGPVTVSLCGDSSEWPRKAPKLAKVSIPSPSNTSPSLPTHL
eukprot:scaffold5812_cov232-Pinguiococcus_pyrenoidosus.AAC.6